MFNNLKPENLIKIENCEYPRFDMENYIWHPKGSSI